MENENALVPISQTSSLFFDVVKFEHAQRVAKMLSSSTIVPEHFRNNIGNAMIALNLADRIKADPFMIMQSMYVVHGRPGLEGKLVIALLNQSGRFDPVEFEEDEGIFAYDPKFENHGVVAKARDRKSGVVLRGPKVTWKLVKAEGWLDKKDKNGAFISKWRTMSQMMFRYRAASFFVKTFCPEVIMGMQTKEEMEDIIDVTPSAVLAKNRPQEQEKTAYDPDIDAFNTWMQSKNLALNETELMDEFIILNAKVNCRGNADKFKEMVATTENGFDDFWTAFQAWVKKKNNGNGKTSDPEAAFRAEWIDLKSPGFKPYVLSQAELFGSCSHKLFEEASQKFAKIYNGESLKDFLNKIGSTNRGEKQETPTENGETSYQEFDRLQKADPEGITEAIQAVGFSNEPGNESGLKAVVEAYKKAKQF